MEIVETETNLLLPPPQQNENLINSKSQSQSHEWIEMVKIKTTKADSDVTNKDFNEELQLKGLCYWFWPVMDQEVSLNYLKGGFFNEFRYCKVASSRPAYYSILNS